MADSAGQPPLTACNVSSVDDVDAPSTSVTSFWIGVVAAIVGSMVLAIGMNVQRLAHLRLQRQRSKANFLFDRTWQLGLVIFVFGNFGDAVALAFAPQSVVTPLGCFSLVANVLSSRVILGERIGAQTAVGRCASAQGSNLASHLPPNRRSTAATILPHRLNPHALPRSVPSSSAACSSS